MAILYLDTKPGLVGVALGLTVVGEVVLAFVWSAAVSSLRKLESVELERLTEYALQDTFIRDQLEQARIRGETMRSFHLDLAVETIVQRNYLQRRQKECDAQRTALERLDALVKSRAIEDKL